MTGSRSVVVWGIEEMDYRKGDGNVNLDSGDDFTSVYAYVKTHKTVHLKYLRFIVCQLCLGKVVL